MLFQQIQKFKFPICLSFIFALSISFQIDNQFKPQKLSFEFSNTAPQTQQFTLDKAASFKLQIDFRLREKKEMLLVKF